MKLRKIAYSAIALSKRKAIKREIKDKHGQNVADRVSKHISEALSELKKFPEMGISMREQYDLDCDYYMFFVEKNYFIYRILDDMIMILEIFNEKEDFMYQMDYEINEDNFVLRAFNPVEELYTYRQSQQICMQSGFIGYMRADFGSNGKQFFSSWNEFNKTLKTPEFAADLDFIINGFRDKDSMFGDRDKLSSFCAMHPEWKIGGDREYYGVRVDTTNYAYMLRFTPRQGDYNIYCHCYKKEWLDKHIENAERGIRFIDPHYNERFVIPDGDTIRIQMEDNKYADYTCRYIDDYHVEVGSQLYHICQFAELMEQNGYKTIPLRSSLPNMAYVFVESHNCVGIVLKGESGYRPTAIYGNTPAETRAEVDKMNGNLKISKAQAQAMNCGSMFGWDTPAADPKNYDDKGNPIKPKRKNKEYER